MILHGRIVVVEKLDFDVELFLSLAKHAITNQVLQPYTWEDRKPDDSFSVTLGRGMSNLTYFPPNQLEMPLFALAVPSSTCLSISSTFFMALALASLAYASASALALDISLFTLAVLGQ